MKQMQTMLKLAMAGACVAFMAAGAMAQTAASTTADSNTLGAADASAAAAPAAAKKPTTSTPRMVDEAQQRSQARSRKAAAGVPEKWGSEEPFTYVPSPGVE